MIQLPEFCSNLQFSQQIVENYSVPTITASPKTIFITQGSMNVFSAFGFRQQNLDKFSYHINNKYQVFGVYDGHGDQKVSEYLENNLIGKIINHQLIASDPQMALRQCFNQIENEVYGLGNNSGSTALVVLLNDQSMIVANMGDSLALGIKNNNQVQILNSLHNLDNLEQLQKIYKKGGIIIRRGNSYRINGQLSLSRSIGDTCYKDVMCKQLEIKKYSRKAYSRVVLATDGLWTSKKKIDLKSTQELQKILNLIHQITQSKGCKGRFLDNTTFIDVSIRGL